jgi:dephospho-CoA kinase
VVFDVPLLTESSHWRARVQRVLVVDCEEATQIARVATRPGWTVQKRLSAWWPCKPHALRAAPLPMR